MKAWLVSLIAILFMVLTAVVAVSAETVEQTFNYTMINNTVVIHNEDNVVILGSASGTFMLRYNYECSYQELMNASLKKLNQTVFNLQNGTVKCSVNNTDFSSAISSTLNEEITTVQEQINDLNDGLVSCFGLSDKLNNCTLMLDEQSDDDRTCDERVALWSEKTSVCNDSKNQFLIIAVSLLVFCALMLIYIISGGSFFRKKEVS